jgi:hypothetical protein
MVLTIWCISIVVGSLLAVGVPAVWITSGRRPFTEMSWVQAPFLGASLIVLVCQNLVYLDVPVVRSAPLLWGVAAVGWLWFWRSGQVRVSLARFPRRLFLVALLVYLTQGLGLLLMGARWYLGRMWGDECNYTVTAEFLAHSPFSGSLPELGSQPWLCMWVRVLKGDRIGQSVLHAFFAVSSWSNPRYLFEPTILLGPTLVVLAVYALGRAYRLDRGWATFTAAVAGMLPSLAQIHLESFLSHALMTPFLLYLPVALYDLLGRPLWRRVVPLALIFAAAASIYTEFLPLIALLLALISGVGAVGRRQGWRVLGQTLLILSAPLALNPMSLPPILRTLSRVDMAVLQGLYPWALKVEGVARLWFGDLVDRPRGTALTLLRAVGLGATYLSCLGLGMAVLPFIHDMRRTWRDTRTRASFALVLGVLTLALLPAGALVRDDDHSYQFYKLLLSVSPLLVLGLILLARTPRPVHPGMLHAEGISPRRGVLPVPAFLLLGTGLVGAVASTSWMAYESTQVEPRSRMHVGPLGAMPVQAVQRELENMQGQNIIFACTNGQSDEGGYLASWLAYSARRNHVWTVDPWLFGQSYEGVPETSWFLGGAAASLPSNVKILTRRSWYGNMHDLGGVRSLWDLGPYTMLELGNGPWAFPLGLVNPNGVEELTPGATYFWMGQGDTQIEILASAPGQITLRALVAGGPCLPPNAGGTIHVATNHGYEADHAFRQAHQSITVPVVAGLTVIGLTPRDAAVPVSMPNGETRPLLWLVRLVGMAYAPAESP